MIIRLNGRFGASEQDALREGFKWVTTTASIDLANATLAAGALGEIMALASRIGPQNVDLFDPTPVMRKILTLTHLNRVLRVSTSSTERYDKSA